MFLSCSVWRDAAENVAESLTKGMRVIVQGRLRSRSGETKEGEKRTVFEVEVDEVGPALRYATAKVTGRPAGGGRPQQQRKRPEREDDPWAAAQPGGAAQANQDPWGTPGQGRADVEAPF
jgi:single-strand DNA-binding protein